MKHLIIAAMIALGSAAPLVAAHAGEGNGPSFPGLQIPNVGIATGPYGQRQVVSTEEHTSDLYANQVSQSPFPQYGTPAQNRRTLAMIEAATPNG